MEIKPEVLGWEQEENSTSHSDKVKHGWTISEDTAVSDKIIPFKKLYPDKEVSPYLTTAISLLDEAIEKIEEALDAVRNNDLIGSDNAVLHILSILPELFCCRSIGEGYATLINAIFHGIKNNGDDKILTEDQLISLKIVCIKLSNEVFMNFSTALELVIKLEDAGLIIEPKHFKPLSDIVNE